MKIEKRDYELALISTESSLFQARLALEREEAEANLASIEWKRVGKGDASSLTLREPQLAQARAVLAAAEAAYEQSKRNLERTSIIAPFDGRVRTYSFSDTDLLAKNLKKPIYFRILWKYRGQHYCL